MARKTQAKPTATTYSIGAQTTLPQAPLTATGRALAAPATTVAPQAQTAQQGQLLAVVAHAAPRAGTNRAAVWAALVNMQGQPRQAVLQAVAAAENSWRQQTGKTGRVSSTTASRWFAARRFGTNIAWQ
jgi:hypothetical protein